MLSRKISVPFKHYVMKIILPDAESCVEHNENKYSPVGQTMAELWSFLCLDVGKITEKNENEMNKSFWTIVKKVTFFARFVD